VIAVAIFFPFLAQAQTNDENKNTSPTVSKKPLSDEQLSVYRDFLKAWRPVTIKTLNLAFETDVFERTGTEGEDDCLKDFVAEATPQNVIHRFTDADVSKMGPLGGITLVDREAQRKEVASNDPVAGVQNGKSVEDAVRNGFNHGLFIFSEIQFDRRHERAVLTYTFYCGEQCGNGGSVVLSRSTGVWVIISRCQQWIASEIEGRIPTVKQVTMPCESQPFKIKA
jgi:hypothetical protein